MRALEHVVQKNNSAEIIRISLNKLCEDAVWIADS